MSTSKFDQISDFSKTNIPESFQNNSDMKSIFEKMSSGFQPKLVNPFNDPNFVKAREDKFKAESASFHSMIRAAMSKDDNTEELESLANQLRQNAGFNDFDACLKLTEHPRFFEFCDIKDSEGFTAMNYSVTYGHNDISKLLLDAGAEVDSKNLSDFINIGNTDDLDKYIHMEKEFDVDEPVIVSTEDLNDITTAISTKYKSNIIKKYGCIPNDPITGDILVNYNEMRMMEVDFAEPVVEDPKDVSLMVNTKKGSLRGNVVGKRVNHPGRRVVASGDKMESDICSKSDNESYWSKFKEEPRTTNESNPVELKMSDFLNIGKVEKEMLAMGMVSERLTNEEIQIQQAQWKHEHNRSTIESSNVDESHQLSLDSNSSRPNQTYQLPTTELDKVIRINAVDGFEESFKKRAGAKAVFGITDKFTEPSLNNIIEDPVNTQSKVSKKKSTNGSISKNFAAAMKKNFANNKFSEDRPITKISVPEKKQVSPEEIEEMMSKMNFDSYALRNNEFLEKYSTRDVSKLLITEGNIDIKLLEHRDRMLPPHPKKEDMTTTIKSTLKAQIGYLSRKKLDGIVDSVFMKLLFYRNMFRRLTPIDNVVVRESPVHGQGIFATKKIKNGDIITFYFPYFLEHVHVDKADIERDGEGIILTPVISRRNFSLENDGELSAMRRGAIKIEKDFYLVGDDQYVADHRFLGHLANDPCDFSKGPVDALKYESEIINKANASIVSYSEDRKYVYLAAIRTIEIDEEIFVPYGTRYWEIDDVDVSAYNSEPTPSGKSE